MLYHTICCAALAAVAAIHVHQAGFTHAGEDSIQPKHTGIFYLATGPTGSGKSGQEKVIDATMQIQGFRQGNFEMMLVDDYIENDAEYKLGVLNYLRAQLGGNPTDSKVKEWATNATSDVFKEFAKLYFGCREDWGCGGDGGCWGQFAADLDEKLNQGKNIALETTGRYYPKQMLEAVHGLDGQRYRFIVGANAVPFQTIIDRNQQRAADGIIRFLKNQSNPAPRFPDVSNCTLAEKVTEIVEATRQMIDCVGEETEDCGPGMIHELYLIDAAQWPPSIEVHIDTPKTKSKRDNPIHKNTTTELKKTAKHILESMLPPENMQCP